MLDEPLHVVGELARVLDALAIDYVIGGSLASSVFGVPRSTADADILANIRDEHVDALVAALASDWYVDARMIRDAIARRRSFNVINLSAMFKVDVFVPRDEWSAEELRRSVRRQFVLDGKTVKLRFASPEDVLLHKLHWYRLGNRVSERQWLDVLGMLRVQGDALDWEYVDSWAERLGLVELLRLARSQR